MADLQEWFAWIISPYCCVTRIRYIISLPTYPARRYRLIQVNTRAKSLIDPAAWLEAKQAGKGIKLRWRGIIPNG